jgi:hypothetical protein
MEVNHFFWRTHNWIGRRLEVAPGAPVILQACSECGRDFVEERSTGEQYAVHVSIFKIHRLSDEVTARWFSEKCPAKYLMADDADRQTRCVGAGFGSTLGEIANHVKFRPGTKLKNQLADRRAISARRNQASANGEPAGGG